MKKAFSLVELIVVVAIIGIMAAVLLGTFSGGSDAARTARCMGNLRNLGTACQSAAAATGYYPPAGSFETLDLSMRNGRPKKTFEEVKGWISWDSGRSYPSESHAASASWNISAYTEDEETRWFAVTNGLIWRYVGESHASYVCPAHAKVMQKLNPNWSYAMNAYFRWDSTHGAGYVSKSSPGYRYFGKLDNAARRLLFAEIPFVKAVGLTVPEEANEMSDSVLQYSGAIGCTEPESIGFNHKAGKRYYANVCFADGHVEKLAFPKNGMSDAEAQELTKWLCEGYEVSYDGSKYERLNQ